MAVAKKMNLLQKLGAIQAEVIGLQADKAGNGYKYLTGTKLLSYIKPLMIEYGLLLKPEIIGTKNERMDYQVSLAQNKSTGEWQGKPKSEILTTLEMRMTWIDIDSGEREECLWSANGQNDWEKGLGSALTYGERYFLMKFFHLDTSEDDVDNVDRKERGRGALLAKVEAKWEKLEKGKKDAILNHYKVANVSELEYDQLATVNAKI